MTGNEHLTPEEREAIREYQRHQERLRRRDRGLKKQIVNTQEDRGKADSGGLAKDVDFSWDW